MKHSPGLWIPRHCGHLNGQARFQNYRFQGTEQREKKPSKIPSQAERSPDEALGVPFRWGMLFWLLSCDPLAGATSSEHLSRLPLCRSPHPLLPPFLGRGRCRLDMPCGNELLSGTENCTLPLQKERAVIIAPRRTGIAIYPQQENVILGQKGAVMFSCYSSWQHFSIAQTVLS